MSNDNGGEGNVSEDEWRAVTFTTSGSAFSVSSVTLRLVNYENPTDQAIVAFYLGDEDAPTGGPIATLTAPGSTDSGYANFQFTATPFTLQPDTFYWLVISAGPNDPDSPFSWVRADPVITPVSSPSGLATFGNQMISQDGGGTWALGSSGAHTFEITGTVVPEPSVNVLLGCGVVALLVVAKRRRSVRA